MAVERVISADSHVSLPREMVHDHLSTQLREKVAAAEAELAARMLQAKPQKVAQKALAEEREKEAPRGLPNMGEGAPWPAAGRAGGSDPAARLEDRDLDGGDAEIH